MADFTVVTYGGGEILKHVFNGIALLFNGGQNGIIQPLVIVTASIGGVWAISKAFFASSAETLLVQYLLPLIVLPGLLMVPTASVHIEDILKNSSYKIDHVPLFLAKFSELVSSLGYRTTTAIEAAMHTPQDISYNRTGMLFGADTALDIDRYKITNANMEQNLRRFAKQCILYDVTLGRYSVDELRKTTDLWQFLKDRTSNVRMIHYFDPGDKQLGKGGLYLSCKGAVDKMTPLLEKEKRYYAQHEVLKHLPLAFQAITGMQKEQEELISQQLVMNVLSNEYSGSQFAKNRAQAQQKSTYQILGSLASSSLVTMRAVIEALIYGAFILVMPLVFLPGGIKFLSTWIWLTIWIQLWPPFYAILNYIMHSMSKSYSNSVFYGLTTDMQGLSIFTSIGLQNLHEDIVALSGYLAASIPFISYAILQGGAQSFIQLAGSMMTPAHSAATSTAGEQVSGNYSLANTNMGQSNYHNASAFQQTYAPALSSGYFTENTGDASVTYSSGEAILKQANSDLRTSFFSDESISQNLQKAHQHAQTSTANSQKSYMDSISGHSRTMYDLTEHIAKSQNFGESLSSREALDVQESARYLQNTAENWGKQYGFSARESMETMAGASIGGNLYVMEGKLSTSMNRGVSEDEVLNSALNVTSNQDFQKHYQRVRDFSEGSSYSALNDEGVRLVEGFTQSLDQVHSSQNQYQSSLSHLNQVSENMAWTESNSQSLKQSLNQDFINWASEKYQHEGGFSHAMDVIKKGPEEERISLANEFVNHTRHAQDHHIDGFQMPQQAHADAFIITLDANEQFTRLESQAYQEGVNRDLEKGNISWRHGRIDIERDSLRKILDKNFESSESSISERSQAITSELNTLHNASKLDRMANGLSKKDNSMEQASQMHAKPFWMSP